MKIVWEQIFQYIDENRDFCRITSRAEIFGGWLINECVRLKDQISTSTIFIPDPGKDWGKNIMDGAE